MPHMDLLARFQQTVRGMGILQVGDPVVIGVSGGPDSLALLHLFARSRETLGVSPYALHVNHLIRGVEAEADARFVRETAQAWGVPVETAQVDVLALARKHRLSIEEAARQARYTLLSRMATEVGSQVIAVGHNADDQAETVLMHLLRGSGLAGLRGMLPVTPLSAYHLLSSGNAGATPESPAQPLQLIRPLLGVPRAEIDAYCATQGLQPRLDHTNLDITLFRNRLRREVIPLLESLIPGLRERLGRTASVLAADYALLYHQVEAAWAASVIEESDRRLQFNLGRWRALPLALQRAMIRKAVCHLKPDLRDINFKHVEAAVDIAQRGHTGAQSTLPGGVMLIVDYDRLAIVTADQPPAPPDWPLLTPNTSIEISGLGVYPLPASEWSFNLTVYGGPRQGEGWHKLLADPWCAPLDIAGEREHQSLQIRTRRPGDRFYPQGAGGSQKIADFMVNAKIPVAWRDSLPLLVVGDAIAWLCGWRVDERFVAKADAGRIWLARFSKRG